MNRRFSPSERRVFTDANREAWDEAAPVHAESNQARLLKAFSNPGFNTLERHCLDRLNEIGVEGKSIAHVCCNNGRELLSLKNMGAGKCVGFDASAAFIEQARALANVSGHTDVTFVITDVYDIAQEHAGPFDIVVITIGVFGWMPDLAGFLQVLARLTRAGGHLFVEETHPVLMMYEEGENDAPAYPKYSYFKQEPWVETSGLDYYQGIKYPSKPNYSFQHTLADMVMAAIGVGFSLEHFAEFGYDISCFCADLEHAQAKPPMGMTMVWKKEPATPPAVTRD